MMLTSRSIDSQMPVELFDLPRDPLSWPLPEITDSPKVTTSAKKRECLYIMEDPEDIDAYVDYQFVTIFPEH